MRGRDAEAEQKCILCEMATVHVKRWLTSRGACAGGAQAVEELEFVVIRVKECTCMRIGPCRHRMRVVREARQSRREPV